MIVHIDLDDFLARITREFKRDEGIDAEQVARAVFMLFSERITAGEMEDVKQVLPKEVRNLWPESVAPGR